MEIHPHDKHPLIIEIFLTWESIPVVLVVVLQIFRWFQPKINIEANAQNIINWITNIPSMLLTILIVFLFMFDRCFSVARKREKIIREKENIINKLEQEIKNGK